jgi:hypothetical protein
MEEVNLPRISTVAFIKLDAAKLTRHIQILLRRWHEALMKLVLEQAFDIARKLNKVMQDDIVRYKNAIGYDGIPP